MATHAGNEGSVYVGANQVAEVRSYQIEETQNTSDDTVMGDTWQTHLVTQKSWTAQCDVLWDETDTNGQGALTGGASITLNVYPEGNTTGDTYYTGTATVTSISRSASYDGLVEASISLQGNGALTESTVS